MSKNTNPFGSFSPKKNVQQKMKKTTEQKIASEFKKNGAGTTIKSGPPSKAEQERMRKQGSRNAAAQYSGAYSSNRPTSTTPRTLQEKQQAAKAKKRG